MKKSWQPFCEPWEKKLYIGREYVVAVEKRCVFQASLILDEAAATVAGRWVRTVAIYSEASRVIAAEGAAPKGTGKRKKSTRRCRTLFDSGVWARGGVSGKEVRDAAGDIWASKRRSNNRRRKRKRQRGRRKRHARRWTSSRTVRNAALGQDKHSAANSSITRKYLCLERQLANTPAD